MTRVTTRWSPEEVTLLKDMHGRVCSQDIGYLLERTRASVASMLYSLGFRDPHSHIACRWTEDEKAFLVKNHRVLTNQQIADQLGRTRGAIRVKIRALRLSGQVGKPGSPQKWTGAEETYLLLAWQTDSLRDIAAALGRTVPAIRLRAKSELKVQRPLSYYASLGQDYRILPAEVRELLTINNKLKKRLRDEEHRRSAGKSVRRVGRPQGRAV